jgi:hypothetical protein
MQHATSIGRRTFGMASESRRIRYSSRAPSAVPSTFGTITNQSLTTAPYLVGTASPSARASGSRCRRTLRAILRSGVVRGTEERYGW